MGDHEKGEEKKDADVKHGRKFATVLLWYKQFYSKSISRLKRKAVK